MKLAAQARSPLAGSQGSREGVCAAVAASAAAASAYCAHWRVPTTLTSALLSNPASTESGLNEVAGRVVSPSRSRTVWSYSTRFSRRRGERTGVGQAHREDALASE